MEPTKVTIRKLKKPQGKVLAYVEIEFDNLLTICDLKIVNGRKGLFLAMPQKPSGNNDDKYYNRVFLKDAWVDGTPGQDYQNKLQATVLKKFAEEGGRPVFEDQGSTTRNTSGYSDPGIKDDDVPF